jgi:hypothetical protein
MDFIMQQEQKKKKKKHHQEEDGVPLFIYFRLLNISEQKIFFLKILLIDI